MEQIKLVVIGGLGQMLGPASQHWSDRQEVKVLRALDRGAPGAFRDQCRKQWQAQGAQLVSSIKELIGSGEFDGVVICAGKNGDDYDVIKECVAELKAYTKKYFILHLSTVSCQFVTATDSFCRQRNIEYVNYPLTGGSTGAANASMLILGGGNATLYRRLEPILIFIGQPRYLGAAPEAGAQVKFLGHVQVYYGLMGIATAVNLDSRCRGYNEFTPDQASLFDFLSQGAGGTKQWDVAMKHGIANNRWSQGFLLKHAVVDLIYLIQLMVSRQLPCLSINPLLSLAYSFTYIAQHESEDIATQIYATYLLPEKVAALTSFVQEQLTNDLSLNELLNRCVTLLPERIRDTVMLNVDYR